MKKAKRKTKSPRASSAVDQYIGARMREGRRAISMTQANLGEKLGVTFQQIQQFGTALATKRLKMRNDWVNGLRATDMPIKGRP